MRYGFYIFSGTGNTEKFAKEVEFHLVNEGNECEFWRFKRGEKYPNFDRFDTFIIGFPVHAFNAPMTIIDFLKKMPCGKQSVYFLATSGEPLKLNDCAFINPKKILQGKGYTVCGGFRAVMPYNIIFRHSDKMASRMWINAKKIAQKASSIILENSIFDIKVRKVNRIFSTIFRIEHPVMPLIGKVFFANNQCIGCGLCEKVCPQANIFIRNNKPVFGKSCVGCMGCAFMCPKDAIRTGILNAWKVNGAYNFDAEPANDDELCFYLRKTYLSYFLQTESMIK